MAAQPSEWTVRFGEAKLTQFRLPADIRAAIEVAAREAGRTHTDIVCEAIVTYLSIPSSRKKPT